VSQDQDLQTAQNRLVTLRSTYATLLSSSSNSSSNLLSVVEPAVAPQQAASPRPLLNTLLAAILGLLVALAFAFLIEYLDDTVKSEEDVEAAVALPALGGIGRMKSDKKQRSEIYHLVTLLYPRSSIAEAYRTLRTNTEFAMVDAPVRTLLVTSTLPGEGKTTTAGNLAVAFAQAGRRTLLVDADLRKPGIHRLFDLPNAYGLSTLFRSEDASIEQLVNTTEQDRLSVLTSGPLPPNPAELLASKRFTAILHRLREAYDLVVIDSPPLQAVTDAAILASVTDGTIFVIDAGRTRRGAAAQGREALAKAGAHVLGAVMNRLSSRVRGDYYYNAYAAYGVDDGPTKSAAGPAPAIAVVTEKQS
jgi:capsular exopolysaccharide synthesis family protein